MVFLLKSSILITVFFLCYRLFLQNETFFQQTRWFLLFGLVASIALPLVVIPTYIEYVPQVNPEVNISFLKDLPSQQENGMELKNLLIWTYIGGVLFFSGKFMIQLASLRRQFLSVRHRQIDHGFHFIETSENVPPFSFFNRIVYNPNHFTPGELDLVIKHELAHARGLHSIDILLVHAFCTVFWCNPFVWLYKLSIRQNLEYIADSLTQEELNCDTSYQTTILKACLQTHQLPITNHFSTTSHSFQCFGRTISFGKPLHQIKKRILMLQSSKSNRVQQLKFFIVLPLIALFLMSFSRRDVFVPIKTSTVIQTDTTEHWNVLKFTVNKTTTDKQLDDITARFKVKDADVRFKDILRNSNGYIIGIAIDFKSKNSNGNFKLEDNQPIDDLVVMYDVENKTISVKNYDSALSQTIKTGTTRVKIPQDSSSTEKNVWIQKNKEGGSNYKFKISDENVRVVSGTDSISAPKGSYVFMTKGDSSEPIFILNGKPISNEEMNRLHAETIESVDVLKDESATKGYGAKGKNGVVIIRTKDGQTINRTGYGSTSQSSSLSISNSEPLIVINGKIQNHTKIDEIQPDDIASINVLKDKKATIAYGDKGGNGVIEITTKSKSPWVLNSESTAVEYYKIDDDKTSFEFIIDQYTEDGRLDILEKEFNLKKMNLKFSKVRRNKKGEITSIKISLDDNNGKQSSATFKEKEETIPAIVIGKHGDKLLIRSLE